MVKTFNTPTPAPEPEPTDPIIARTSPFSPFGNPTEDRKKILGDKLFSLNETVAEIPDHEVNSEFEKVEKLFERAASDGTEKMLKLVKTYRAVFTKSATEQDQKRKMVKFYRELLASLKDDNADAVLISFVGNLSFLLAKMGK